MKLSAVLLAGGESRRMGRDKATLEFRGEPLWQRQIRTLGELDPVEILVSARTEPDWLPAETTFVPDDAPSRGPLSGLAAALRVMRGSHLLALAVDMPLMTEAYLRSLCDLAGPGRGVLPMSERRAEPLTAVYPRKSSPTVVSGLASEDVSLQSITGKLVNEDLLRVVYLSRGEKRLYYNINTLADLRNLEYATS